MMNDESKPAESAQEAEEIKDFKERVGSASPGMVAKHLKEAKLFARQYANHLGIKMIDDKLVPLTNKLIRKCWEGEKEGSREKTFDEYGMTVRAGAKSFANGTAALIAVLETAKNHLEAQEVSEEERQEIKQEIESSENPKKDEQAPLEGQEKQEGKEKEDQQSEAPKSDVELTVEVADRLIRQLKFSQFYAGYTASFKEDKLYPERQNPAFSNLSRGSAAQMRSSLNSTLTIKTKELFGERMRPVDGAGYDAFFAAKYKAKEDAQGAAGDRIADIGGDGLPSH